MKNEMVFQLYPYKEVTSHSKEVNPCQLEYVIHLKLPDDIGKHITLYDICEVKNGKCTPIDFLGFISREHQKPWIDLKSEILNLEIGLHIYQFKFVHVITETYLSLYFAYHIQSDQPDTSSYIYMER